MQMFSLSRQFFDEMLTEWYVCWRCFPKKCTSCRSLQTADMKLFYITHTRVPFRFHLIACFEVPVHRVAAERLLYAGRGDTDEAAERM